MTTTKLGLCVLTDLAPDREWVLAAGLPERLVARFADRWPVSWHARRPGERYTDEHRQRIRPAREERSPRRPGLRRTLQEALRPRRKEAESGPPCDVTALYEHAVPRLLEHARAAGLSHLALVADDRVAVLPEGVELALGIAEREAADGVVCLQADGLLPVLVSVGLLERWLAADPEPDPRWLASPDRLRDFGRVVDLELVDPKRVPGRVRCHPFDRRELRLVEHWEQRAPELARALEARQEGAGADREPLERLLLDYRARFAAGLETYRVVGDLKDVDELRARMTIVQKPVIEHIVMATHYVRFLRRYAGLGEDSHVVDVGCSWGYLPICLANVLSPRGAYLGIEVQRDAAEWTRERLAWLGDNYRFVHLDIHNDLYNPDGSAPRDQVGLPVEDGWADLVVAGSVYTHMQEDGVRSYFAEFRRILAPGGVAAFSILDSSLWGKGEDYGLINDAVPDEGTVYSRGRVEALLAEAGLEPAREPAKLRQFDHTEFQTWHFARRRDG